MVFCHMSFRKDYAKRIDLKEDYSEILFLSFCKKIFCKSCKPLHYSYVALILSKDYSIRNCNSISVYLKSVTKTYWDSLYFHEKVLKQY